MKIISKIFLATFVITLALSFTKPGSEFMGGILKPAATIFFMLFFITMAFGGIIADYDREQRLKPGTGSKESDPSAPFKDSASPSKVPRHQPAVTSAHYR